MRNGLKTLSISLLFLLQGCLSDNSEKLLKEITLKQPHIIDSSDDARQFCVLYKFKNGRWSAEKIGNIKECDLILGLSFSDFEKLQRFLKSCDAKSKGDLQ